MQVVQGGTMHVFLQAPLHLRKNSGSGKYNLDTSSTNTDDEMDFNTTIDTNIDINRDNISNRLEIEDSIEIQLEIISRLT